jgi:enoyl-CoA hydratase
MADAVLTESDGGIAVITINRPEARNAVDGEVARGIAAAVDEFDDAGDVRVIILTGAGGTFSAGMDLKGFLTGDSAGSPSGRRPSRRSPRSRGTRLPAVSSSP